MAQRIGGSPEQDLADINNTLSEIKDLLGSLPNKADYLSVKDKHTIFEMAAYASCKDLASLLDRFNYYAQTVLDTLPSRLDYFAAHVPENIPAWFQVDQEGRPTKPTLHPPKHLEAICWSWLADPSWDLDTEQRDTLEDEEFMCLYQEAWSEYWQKESEWQKGNEQKRYFAWRWYYARSMVNNP